MTRKDQAEIQQHTPAADQKSSEAVYDENVVCDRCGRFGAFRFGDKALCLECYEAFGSCCVEFGGEDLWEPAR
jgi:hypothetical protein